LKTKTKKSATKTKKQHTSRLKCDTCDCE